MAGRIAAAITAYGQRVSVHPLVGAAGCIVLIAVLTLDMSKPALAVLLVVFLAVIAAGTRIHRPRRDRADDDTPES